MQYALKDFVLGESFLRITFNEPKIHFHLTI